MRCIKILFGYSKFHSIIAMLTDLNLSNFDAVIDILVAIE